jgi:hypothetical protein
MLQPLVVSWKVSTTQSKFCMECRMSNFWWQNVPTPGGRGKSLNLNMSVGVCIQDPSNPSNISTISAGHRHITTTTTRTWTSTFIPDRYLSSPCRIIHTSMGRKRKILGQKRKDAKRVILHSYLLYFSETTTTTYRAAIYPPHFHQLHHFHHHHQHQLFFMSF